MSLIASAVWITSGCTGNDRDDEAADSVISLESASGTDTEGTDGDASDGTNQGSDGSGSDSDDSAASDGNSDGETSAGSGDGPKFDVGDGAGTGGTVACEVQQPTVSFVEPTLIFVLDKSGSMGSTFDAGGNTITRWNALHNTVTSLLNDYEDLVLFGAKWFPATTSCPVNAGLEVPPALNNGGAILQAIPPANEVMDPYALTPVQDGFEAASTVIETYDLDASPTAVMLILDGGVSTSCTGNTAAGTESAIGDLYNNFEVPTYVVGVDIGSAGTINDMNDYAEAGGVPRGMPGDAERFYNAVNTMELQEFMDEIVGQILTCEIELSSQPEHPDLTEVSVGGMDYPQITQAECEAGNAGWYWSSQYDEITLCGASCDEFKVVQAASVEFFCPAG